MRDYDSLASVEIVALTKADGPLTKRIYLSDDGNVLSDGSACIMVRGSGCRVRFDNLAGFAEYISSLAPNEAIALGMLRPDLPNNVEITTKDKLNGIAQPGIIARTADHIVYCPGQPALALIDIDLKGMPSAVKTRIDALGGFWLALVSVLPKLEGVGRVLRKSTSAGIYRTDTGELLAGSNGQHVFVVVQDGADIERFLRTLHFRCWLHGLGWMMVGAGGQLLERSIVDRMVGAPERLVFEGPPVLAPPLSQDRESRRPTVTEGEMLDTLAACPPLTVVEQARLRELRAQEGHRLKGESARAREALIGEQSRRLAKRTGMSADAAAKIIARQCEGILLPDVVLPFDDAELAGFTVADVLADPARFDGATLADPLEGIEYGRCKAKVMRRPDGKPWINSFAHGRATYELKLDARAVRAAIEKAPPTETVNVFVRSVFAADLNESELEELGNLTHDRTGIGKRAIERQLKAARKDQARRSAEEERSRHAAERQDPRPEFHAPACDAPWLPQMAILNEVLGSSTAEEPPARDIDGVMVQVRVRRVPNMHALTAAGANEGDTVETRLPALEQPLLARLSEAELGELIEHHIDYVTIKRSQIEHVHLAGSFVDHFRTRPDNALPIIAAIATLPIVLGDGALLAKRGLHRERGIIFRVPPELLAVLPRQEDCTPTAVAEAMRFLTDVWLCDVAADYNGKATLITAALSLIERTLLPDRPVYFMTAGRRGGGKTTTLIMLLMAVTGVRPPAAAWSPNQEERRKALLAYLLQALPAIIWDNISRGTHITCPHIEAACTTAFYSDRRLGETEIMTAAASAIQFFTGNNIGPRGDLASRSLKIRLEVDRADPENRVFKHPDPIAWTEAHRGQILRALYTVLLGNPRLRPRANLSPPETRFKAWWHMIGSAVEHAANQHADHVAAAVMDAHPTCKPHPISFRELFLSQEADNEDTASLTDALSALATIWPNEQRFDAAAVARIINSAKCRDDSSLASNIYQHDALVLREFLFPELAASQAATPKATGKRLGRYVDDPVNWGERTLVLKTYNDKHTKDLRYFVRS